MIQSPTEAIQALFKTISSEQIVAIEVLPASGGDRTYYRVFSKKEGVDYTCIATCGRNIEEHKSFIKLSKFFADKGLPVPSILAVNEDASVYLQEDCGNDSLLQLVNKEGFTEKVYALYKDAVHSLAKLQTIGSALKTDLLKFDADAILHDLLYFKFYFLDTLSLNYSKQDLLKEFQALSNNTANLRPHTFMYRDFQARNIMVKEDKVCFIDFQGGLLGHPAYDVASLLYQAKAALPQDWKDKLWSEYYTAFNAHKPTDQKEFTSGYQSMVFIRMIQTLGAYGFRGLFERKSHFISSIQPALLQLKSFLNNYDLNDYPVFKNVLSEITKDEIIQKFKSVRANEHSNLVVHINSFSFIKRGYPMERSENGGGYVFDCRGILNPGRLEEFKTQTGRDKDVMTFLETKTQMGSFLQHIFDVVDVTVENYLERNFDHLTISFGCTGGQHRSVYAADALDKHLREKYNVKTVVHHMEQPFTTNPKYD